MRKNLLLILLLILFFVPTQANSKSFLENNKQTKGLLKKKYRHLYSLQLGMASYISDQNIMTFVPNCSLGLSFKLGYGINRWRFSYSTSVYSSYLKNEIEADDSFIEDEHVFFSNSDISAGFEVFRSDRISIVPYAGFSWSEIFKFIWDNNSSNTVKNIISVNPKIGLYAEYKFKHKHNPHRFARRLRVLRRDKLVFGAEYVPYNFKYIGNGYYFQMYLRYSFSWDQFYK
ncbi:MAG: hypothetical protein ACEPOW_08245 [Bacteroidales bacterium]